METEKNDQRPHRMPVILILGTLLTVATCYWITVAEALWDTIHITVQSICYSGVFSLLVLLVANVPLKRFLPRAALRKPELLMIYMMTCMGATVSGQGIMQLLVPMMGDVYWYATPENEWANLIWPHIPSWMGVSNRAALTDHYVGESTFYTLAHFRAWIGPVLAWSAFLFVLVLVMLMINVLVRRPWVEGEKLTYPIIQLPLRMINEPSALFRNRLLWLGFAIAAGLDLLNALHHAYPSIPGIHLKVKYVGHYFTERPWSAIGGVISFYPFIIGLGYFIPLDLLFSCWFFYLFWRVQRVLIFAFGLSTRAGSFSGYQAVIEQASGGYIGLFIIAMWLTRRHIVRIAKSLLGLEKMDESNEPMPYRSALILLVLGLVFLVGFSRAAGMSIWLAVGFFAVFYVLATAVTRMRAEMGVPAHDMHNGGPDLLIPSALGTRSLGSKNLSILYMFWFFTRSRYSDPMPNQLEGFKLAERTHTNTKAMLIVILFGVFISIIATFWSCLDTTHRVGMANTRIDWIYREPASRLQNWLLNPTEPNPSTLILLGVGMLSTFFLAFMRMRFLWWPFHPAGYAVSNSWGVGIVWLPLLIAWIIKGLVLRYGGLKMFRRVMPFFMGLMLGEFVVGSSLSIMGTALGKTYYAFWVYQ